MKPDGITPNNEAEKQAWSNFYHKIHGHRAIVCSDQPRWSRKKMTTKREESTMKKDAGDDGATFVGHHNYFRFKDIMRVMKGVSGITIIFKSNGMLDCTHTSRIAKESTDYEPVLDWFYELGFLVREDD